MYSTHEALFIADSPPNMPASGQIPDLPDDASSNAISGPSNIGSTPGPSNAGSNAIPGPSNTGPPTSTSQNVTASSTKGSSYSLFDDTPYLQLSDDLTETAYNPWG
jgi:hypothetical protein